MNYHYSMYWFNQKQFINAINLIKYKSWIYPFKQQTKLIKFDVYLINILLKSSKKFAKKTIQYHNFLQRTLH